MNIFQQLLHLANRLSGGMLSKKRTASPQDMKSYTWKVDWVNEQGEKGTFETHLTDLQEAEWKFNYMFDDTSKIIKMYKGPASDKNK